MDAINALPTYGEDYGPDANFNNSSGNGGTLPLINYTCCSSVPRADNFVLVNSISADITVMPSRGVCRRRYVSLQQHRYFARRND